MTSNSMTSDSITSQDTYDDEPFPPTGNDQHCPEPPAIRRDLLTYAQAQEAWKATDADLAGWTDNSRIMAYLEIDEPLSRFNWLHSPAPGVHWKTYIQAMLFSPAAGFDHKLVCRYLGYKGALTEIKKHCPEIDAVDRLNLETGLATGKIGRITAINLNGGKLTLEGLENCIFISSEIQSLISIIKGKKEKKKRAPKAKPRYEEVEKVYLDRSFRNREQVAEQLNCSVYHVRKNMGDLARKPRGRRPDI